MSPFRGSVPKGPPALSFAAFLNCWHLGVNKSLLWGTALCIVRHLAAPPPSLPTSCQWHLLSGRKNQRCLQTLPLRPEGVHTHSWLGAPGFDGGPVGSWGHTVVCRNQGPGKGLMSAFTLTGVSSGFASCQGNKRRIVAGSA